MKNFKLKLAVNFFILLLVFETINAQETVRIGNQLWMTKNLNVDRFRNGDSIPEAKTTHEWIKAGKEGLPSWCHYNNDPANEGKYGKLYNWYAVCDPRGIAPEGWDVPDNQKWVQLVNFLGGGQVAGAKMKSKSGWNNFEDKNGNGTNESGFSVLPSGYRNYDGSFDGIGIDGHWWSSSQKNTYIAWFIFLNNGYDLAGTNSYIKDGGFSVRCIKQ